MPNLIHEYFKVYKITVHILKNNGLHTEYHHYDTLESAQEAIYTWCDNKNIKVDVGVPYTPKAENETYMIDEITVWSSAPDMHTITQKLSGCVGNLDNLIDGTVPPEKATNKLKQIQPNLQSVVEAFRKRYSTFS